MIVSKEKAFELEQEQPTHFNYIDKTGTRFGNLQTLHYAGRDSRGKHQFACLCDCGNYCLVTSVNLNETTVGCGCLKSSKGLLLATESRRINLKDTEEWIEQNTPYFVICNNVPATRAKWTLYCKEHGVFKANLNLVKRGVVGCPVCRTGGGYKRNKEGILYVHRVYKESEPICIKFGITNYEISRRKRGIEWSAGNSVTLEPIFIFKDEDGSFIHNLEQQIKSVFKTKVVTKETLPSGYTETVSLEDEESLLNWLNIATNKR